MTSAGPLTEQERSCREYLWKAELDPESLRSQSSCLEAGIGYSSQGSARSQQYSDRFETSWAKNCPLHFNGFVSPMSGIVIVMGPVVFGHGLRSYTCSAWGRRLGWDRTCSQATPVYRTRRAQVADKSAAANGLRRPTGIKYLHREKSRRPSLLENGSAVACRRDCGHPDCLYCARFFAAER